MDTRIVKTRRFLPPKDDLHDLLEQGIKNLQENSIVAISSKVVSIGEGRCISADGIEKDELIKKEVEFYLPREAAPFGRMHTINKDILIGGGGVDESNADGHYILWPKDPDKSAMDIWQFLREEFKVKNLGVILVDSMAYPLKRGIVGIAISYFGFEPLKDNRGKKDLFGRVLKYSQSNIPDSLAAFAVLLMGEANEQTPIVVFEDVQNITFINKKTANRKTYSSWKVPMEEDLFKPFIKGVKWEKSVKVISLL